jgi:hypothetical protein
LYYPSNIIRVIKSRKMRWTEHVAGIGEMINSCRIFVEKMLKETTGETCGG